MIITEITNLGTVIHSECRILKHFSHRLTVCLQSQRQVMPTLDDDSGSDREDELPQVVVLKSGDLTAEEVKKMKDEIRAGGSSEKGESPVQ